MFSKLVLETCKILSCLKEAGRTDKPILLKRGLSATIEEFIYAARIYCSHKVTEILFYVREVFVHTKKQLEIH